ncbi:hypothetical protein BH24ACT3_BH24ACT3_08520 [soil metagenome]
MGTTDATPERLGELVRARWGRRWTVGNLERLTGGASRETWSFDANGPGGEVAELILQRERPGGVRTGGGTAIEAPLLRAARDVGVPVPEVVVASVDADAPAVDLGAPFVITRRVTGETIARRILRDDAYADARPGLATACGRALAAVHAIPVGSAPGLEQPDQVAQFTELLDLLGQPHPAFELGLRELGARRPRAAEVTVVHGDFRLGNLIVGEDGLRAVLDWELAHLGDPVEDLGWLCVKAWRFGAAPVVGGFGAVEDLLGAYREASGRQVDVDALRWWQAMGTLKWGVMCVIQAATHLSGAARSVELAAIGRRVCENEHDLLELLGSSGPPPAPLPEAPHGGERPGPDGPHDVPTAQQLVEAVREWVEGDVASTARGRVAFHARVAARVLSTVERELALGPGQRTDHRARLGALGVADDAALAAAIRAGGFDDRLDDVIATVHAAVRAKLEVANPGYLGPG